MKCFSINAKPGKFISIILAMLPFVLLFVVYVFIAFDRHKENPDDKLVPTVPQIIDGFRRSAFEKDQDGQYRLWVDTLASARRFVIGVALLFMGVIIGLHMGMMPYLEVMLYRFALFWDKVPGITLLPILFIFLGLGEKTKITLIVMSVITTIILDTYLRVKSVPREQIIKAKTLGASDCEISYRVVLRQIFPKVLDNIRLNLKSVIILLITSEAIASTEGLGYRIFLVRRYVAMDIIIAYVIWISVLVFFVDWGLRFFIKKRYPWLDRI